MPDFDLGTGGLGQAERAGFQPFGPHGIAIAVPVEDLDAVATAIEENEEMPGKGVLSDNVLGHLSQAVEAAAHVGGHGADEDTDGRG